jgi:uncharacterized protein (TIGR03083 family)
MLNTMDTAQYGPCDIPGYIARLREEGELLAGAAERAGLDAPVPACPAWRVRDLLKHVGYVHRWAAGYVREQHPKWVDRASEKEILAGGPRDDALPGWFRDGHAALVRALEAAGEDTTCWTFLEAPSPLAFWARRQAHETAIHRVDAEQAAAAAGAAGVRAGNDASIAAGAGAGGDASIAPEFAADGVDELLMGFLGRDAKRESWDGPPGVLGIHADDGTGATAHWRVASAAGQLAVTREAGPADCDITGSAARLYLMLWNRRDTGGLQVRGDPGTLAALREHLQVTWQ